MDWIERVFHLHPDGGSGATETAVAVGLVGAALVAGHALRARIARSREPSGVAASDDSTVGQGDQAQA